MVEAKLNPVDRGYVREGQRAVVKVTAYDYVRYGALEGKVALIAADSTTESSGGVFFRVVVVDKGERAAAQLPKDAVVIYLFNHRSNADYVVAAHALYWYAFSFVFTMLWFVVYVTK